MSSVAVRQTSAGPFRAPPSLASAPPTPGHYRAALLAVAMLGLVTALSLPFARHPGPHIPPFLPMYAVLASAADLVTAYLLLGHFLSARTPSLAVLGGTYLYTGTIIWPNTHQFRVVTTGYRRQGRALN